jgi:hypothetical protein
MEADDSGQLLLERTSTFDESMTTARPRRLLPLASRGFSRQTVDHSSTSD